MGLAKDAVLGLIFFEISSLDYSPPSREGGFFVTFSIIPKK